MSSSNMLHKIDHCVIAISFFVIPLIILLLLNEEFIQSFFLPNTISVVNTLFIAIPSFFISIVAAKAFILNKSISILLFGCAFLTSGYGGLFAGWLFAQTNSTNILVTVHNMGVLISAVAFLVSSSLHSIRHLFPIVNATYTLLFSYLGVLAIISTIAFLAANNMTPIFFVQDEGPTIIRQFILEIGMVLYFLASLQLYLKYIRLKSRFMFWYSSSLFIISIGMSLTRFDGHGEYPV